MKTKETIFQLIRDTLQVEPTTIPNDTPWYELGTESFDLIELIIALEETFNISIKTEDISKISTISELVSFVERKRQP